MSPKPEPLAPEVYARVFEGHAEGAQILEDLTRRFAVGGMFAKDDQGGERETCRRIGRREVVEFIVARINQANGVDDADNQEEQTP